MHFEPLAVPAELLGLTHRFISITGWPPWQKRLESLAQRVADNPLLDEYFAERYSIEVEMGRQYRRILLGEKIELPASYAETALLSFVATTARVHPRLSAKGQARLAGMLRSGLDAETGVASLEHEMGVAAHLMGRGFDVTFSDFENGGGFDFLAERDGAELEVECKTVSGDLGRKIHLRRLYELGGRAFPVLDAALGRRSAGQLALVRLPTRLFGTDQQLRAVCKCLAQAFETAASVPGPDPCAIEYRTFSIAEGPFAVLGPGEIRGDDARRYVESATGVPLDHAVLMFRPRSGAVMMAVESAQPDQVMRGLVKQLKASVKKQFSGTRPGVICVKFLDITQQDLREIAEQDKSGKPSTLKLASSHLLGRNDWKVIHTLAYLTPGRSVASRVVDGHLVTRSVREQSSTYSFKNPNNAVADDHRYSIF